MDDLQGSTYWRVDLSWVSIADIYIEFVMSEDVQIASCEDWLDSGAGQNIRKCFFFTEIGLTHTETRSA